MIPEFIGAADEEGLGDAAYFRINGVSIAIVFSNRQQLCCNTQHLGDLLARRLPHGFFGFLLDVSALRDAEAARNFCLGEAEVFAPSADGSHVFVDDFVDHGVGDGWRALLGQAHVFRVGNYDEGGFALRVFQYLDISRCVHFVSPLA